MLNVLKELQQSLSLFASFAANQSTNYAVAASFVI